MTEKTEVITPDTLSPGYKSSVEAIEVALRSINPIVWVRTHEEKRLIEDINKIAESLKMNVWCWSLWQGLVPAADFSNGIRAKGEYDKTWQPPLAIEKIADLTRVESKKGNIVIMRDVHVALQEPIPRQLKDVYEVLIANKTKLLFVSADLGHGAGGGQAGLPPSLEKQITVIDFDLPSLSQIDEEIRTLIREVIEANVTANATTGNKKASETVNNLKKLTDENYYDFGRALQGLTIREIRNAVSASLFHLKTVNTNFLLDSKKQILAKSDILEYHEPNYNLSDVGGLDLAKEFFTDYKFSHTKEAQEFGVEPLRGVLLVGVPGSGKSLTCKAIAADYKLPLVRLDIGKVMGSLVGQSESRMRGAIKTVESLAPCVTGDTLIQLANGVNMTAKDLYERGLAINDPVALQGIDPETGEKRILKLHAIIRRPASEKKLLQITVEDKVITVTDNHKLLTRRGWVEAKDLVESDELSIL